MTIFFLAPSLPEKKERIEVKKRRALRNHPEFFEAVREKADAFAKPPTEKIKVIARLRKKEYKIIATTWGEFCSLLETQTGIPADQQLIKYNDETVAIDFKKNLCTDCGYQPGTIFYVYNRGGYEVAVASRKSIPAGSSVGSVLTSYRYSKQSKTLKVPSTAGGGQRAKSASGNSSVVSDITLGTGLERRVGTANNPNTGRSTPMVAKQGDKYTNNMEV